MNSNYFFLDNWDGSKRTFQKLYEAKENAKKQTGVSVAIFNAKTNKITHVEASGHLPS